MEINGDGDEYSDVDADGESDTCIESREHRENDSKEPKTRENLTPEGQGDPNSIVDDLYNKLDEEKDDYEFGSIVDNYFKD